MSYGGLEALAGFEPACGGLQPPTWPLGHRTLVGLTGLEPASRCFEGSCSSIELQTDTYSVRDLNPHSLGVGQALFRVELTEQKPERSRRMLRS